jgi:hypothetical protein
MRLLALLGAVLPKDAGPHVLRHAHPTMHGYITRAVDARRVGGLAHYILPVNK